VIMAYKGSMKCDDTYRTAVDPLSMLRLLANRAVRWDSSGVAMGVGVVI